MPNLTPAPRLMRPEIGQRYNALVQDLMPMHAGDLCVDPRMDTADRIGDAVSRKGEYLGGMAAVLLALLQRGDAQATPTLPAVCGANNAGVVA